MSSSGSGISLPAGYSPPFTVVTDDDHSAWIIIATALGLVCVLIFAAARIVVRYAVSSGFGQDDWLLSSSLTFTIIQSSIILYGCSIGLGTSMVDMPSPRQVKIQKIYYTSNLFWTISLGFSKISVAFLLRRIDACERRRVVFTAIAAFTGAWAFASTLALALQCNLAHPWITLNEQCAGMFLRWEVISAFDIFTELLLFAAAIYLIWEVQTSWSRKAIIVTGFACRLPIIIVIAFRLATYDQAGLNDNPSIREALFVVWTQTEINFSIISATIPSLLQFMRTLNTQFGMLTEKENRTYGSRQRSDRSFPMSLLRSGNKTNLSHMASQRAEEGDEITSHGYRASVAKTPGLASKVSVGSNESQKMIIRKEVTYGVAYD